MKPTSLEEQIHEILNNHSCYVCYDDWKSARRKCLGVEKELFSLIKSERLDELTMFANAYINTDSGSASRHYENRIKHLLPLSKGDKA